MRFDAASEAALAARLLNPHAGDHVIPTDWREIEASIRAGAESWRRFPYYEMRYADRGRQFTRSDSAWLATLAGQDEERVLPQIDWLAGVLAARGMPRWLLELHLLVLARELVAAVPERRTRYEVLERAAQHLGASRRACIPDAVHAALAADFDARVGPSWRRRMRGTGGVLVAAVADERAGIARAVSSLEGWMTAVERFPKEWIAAVRATIRAARTV